MFSLVLRRVALGHSAWGPGRSGEAGEKPCIYLGPRAIFGDYPELFGVEEDGG
jgi:hypothetical protein